MPRLHHLITIVMWLQAQLQICLRKVAIKFEPPNDAANRAGNKTVKAS